MAMLTRLRQTLEILRRVKVETGMGYLDGHAWFRSEPLPGFDGMTADRLVREGTPTGFTPISTTSQTAAMPDAAIPTDAVPGHRFPRRCRRRSPGRRLQSFHRR